MLCTHLSTLLRPTCFLTVEQGSSQTVRVGGAGPKFVMLAGLGKADKVKVVPGEWLSGRPSAASQTRDEGRTGWCLLGSTSAVSCA